MEQRTTREIIEWAESQKRQMTVFGSLPVQTYIVHAIKAPFCKILLRIFEKPLGVIDAIRILVELNKIRKRISDNLPEPTLENTWHPNTHILIEVMNEFFEYSDLRIRERELKTMLKFATIINDYDPPYRFLINRFLEIWLKHSKGWIWHDDNEWAAKYWKGDKNGG